MLRTQIPTPKRACKEPHAGKACVATQVIPPRKSQRKARNTPVLAPRTSEYAASVKTTSYFDAIRRRADRRMIEDAWIERAIRTPVRELRQQDGRIRRWAQVPEMENRYLRVILLPDGVTVHHAFFDRRFIP